MTQQVGLIGLYYEDSLETEEIANGKTLSTGGIFLKKHISEVIV